MRLEVVLNPTNESSVGVYILMPNIASHKYYMLTINAQFTLFHSQPSSVTAKPYFLRLNSVSLAKY